jgi:hypothetical protein
MEAKGMKVLVCGSRDWADKKAIERELKKLPPGSTIIHGACPTGADALADAIAMKLGLKIKRYPADWDDPTLPNKKAAGPIRNAKMIREEHKPGDPIAMGLAFTEDLTRSRGAKDCVDRARRVGIKVDVHAQ